MSKVLAFECGPEIHDIVLTCPPLETSGLADAIRARGNCPLDINGEMVAELSTEDIKETWAATRALSAKQVSHLTQALGTSLSDAEQGAVLDSKVADAAAFFLLALRHNHLTPAKALQGCRVTWHPDTCIDQVECL